MYCRLRELRENRGLTQKSVGEVLKMSQTGYNQYEIGKNDPSTYVLCTLARYYNVSVDYILGLTNVQKPYPPA